MIDSQEAKRLDKLEQSLVKKFKEAEKEQNKYRQQVQQQQAPILSTPTSAIILDQQQLQQLSTPLPADIIPDTTTTTITANKEPPLTVEKAKRLEALNTRLLNDFADVHMQSVNEIRERERKYEAITRAIKEQKEKDDREREQREKERRRNQILRRKPLVSSTPRHVPPGYMGRDYDDGEDSSERVELEYNIRTPPPNRKLNQSMKKLMDTKVVTLGSLGARYFPKANDAQFGIWYDETNDRPMIGSEPITFDYDDIILLRDKTSYKGTEGLWLLLTKNDYIRSDQYTKQDWEMYKDILVKTNSLYRDNDPNTKYPKASRGRKWKQMIKQIWDEHNNAAAAAAAATTRQRKFTADDDGVGDDDDGEYRNYVTGAAANNENVVEQMELDQQPTGSGLAIYRDSNVPMEYRYIANFRDLVDRLNYIHAQEVAGNNNFHNEKLSLVNFIHDRMEELVRTPSGTKYLVRCLSALPEHIIRGSGLLNDIINKLPFELHAPRNWKLDTYNFCGPGTKLEKRLIRGDKGINPLDEACKEHDIWYAKHKNTEDRWQADKVLQQKAWDRVVSPDADLNERAVALATTGGMWLKRKLGMGLGTSACLLPQ